MTREEINAKRRERYANDPEYAARKRETNRRYRERNPRADRAAKIKSMYGLTIEVYDELLDRQGGVCAICKEVPVTERGFHVDHCKTTLIVRGILCHHCNTGIGLLRHDPLLLQAAIDYLEEAKWVVNDIAGAELWHQ